MTACDPEQTLIVRLPDTRFDYQSSEDITMRNGFLGVFVILGVLLSSCSEKPIDQDAAALELMELSRNWSAMVASGDLETSIDFWADDAVMLPPDLPALSGKAAIREYVMGAASIPGFKISWEPESASISESGDMGYLIERNVIEMDGENGETIKIHGKVVTVWRKDSNGEWKNVVDMWNSAPRSAD